MVLESNNALYIIALKCVHAQRVDAHACWTNRQNVMRFSAGTITVAKKKNYIYKVWSILKTIILINLEIISSQSTLF